MLTYITNNNTEIEIRTQQDKYYLKQFLNQQEKVRKQEIEKQERQRQHRQEEQERERQQEKD